MSKNSQPATEPAADPTSAPLPESLVHKPGLTWGEAVTAPDPFAHVGDPSWGKGGSYVIDPETGARVPAPDNAQEGA